MTERDRAIDEDMWRPAAPVKTDEEEDQEKDTPPADEHAYEDSWYQVLRRHVGEK
jgi:hypothetical protein